MKVQEMEEQKTQKSFIKNTSHKIIESIS